MKYYRIFLLFTPGTITLIAKGTGGSADDTVNAAPVASWGKGGNVKGTDAGGNQA